MYWLSSSCHVFRLSSAPEQILIEWNSWNCEHESAYLASILHYRQSHRLPWLGRALSPSCAHIPTPCLVCLCICRRSFRHFSPCTHLWRIRGSLGILNMHISDDIGCSCNTLTQRPIRYIIKTRYLEFVIS